jgi:hypothetical protein
LICRLDFFEVSSFPGYRRTVLVLFHKDNEIDVRLAAGGIAEALRKIKSSSLNHQTSEDRKMADYILRKMRPTDTSTCCTMANFAIQTRDFDLWKRVAKITNADKDIKVLGKQRILQACQTFQFQQVQDV